jgi:hypothetical protein
LVLRKIEPKTKSASFTPRVRAYLKPRIAAESNCNGKKITINAEEKSKPASTAIKIAVAAGMIEPITAGRLSVSFLSAHG